MRGIRSKAQDDSLRSGQECPNLHEGQFHQRGLNKQIVIPVSVFAVQFFCLLETARKHSQQERVPGVEYIQSNLVLQFAPF